ncbi:MAG: hypothetical protein AB7V46_23200, partial [Thermomicrobiales bacterium]
ALLLGNIAEIAQAHRNPPPKEPWHLARVRLVHQLEALPGQHLVLVRYGEPHSVHAEWVYNRADIDASRIIWAREVSPEEDRKLLEYFRQRKVWVLYAEEYPVRLEPYRTLHSGQSLQEEGSAAIRPSSNTAQATQ